MNNTKIECSSMFITNGETKTKAIANVTVNDEFVIKGIKIFEGDKGKFMSMPSQKIGSDYSDIVFPINKEMREKINNEVLGAYDKLSQSGLDRMPLKENISPDISTSRITATLKEINSNDHIKAVGQIKIDDSIIVSGVKVVHGTNQQGEEKDFVSMPSYQTQNGDYKEYAHAITKECSEKINRAVMSAYKSLQMTEHKGVPFSDLGNKDNVASMFKLNNKFAEKLMAELDKNGITFSAKVAETTTISVKKDDKPGVDILRKNLSAQLVAAQKQSQPAPAQTR